MLQLCTLALMHRCAACVCAYRHLHTLPQSNTTAHMFINSALYSPCFHPSLFLLRLSYRLLFCYAKRGGYMHCLLSATAHSESTALDGKSVCDGNGLLNKENNPPDNPMSSRGAWGDTVHLNYWRSYIVFPLADTQCIFPPSFFCLSSCSSFEWQRNFSNARVKCKALPLCRYNTVSKAAAVSSH